MGPFKVKCSTRFKLHRYEADLDIVDEIMAVSRTALAEPLVRGMSPDCGKQVRTLCYLLTVFLSAAVLVSQVAFDGGRYVTKEGDAVKMFSAPASASASGTRWLASRQPTPPGLGFRPPVQNFMQPAASSPPVRNSMQPAAYRGGVDPFDSIFWHFTQPSRLRQVPTEDLDLWPRQEPAKEPVMKPEFRKESSDLFHGRNPFKNVSLKADLPTGRYVSRSFVTKTHYGPNGKRVTERYATSAAGNGQEGIHEAKHMYSNSTSSIEKASHEQHLNGRSRLAVTEYGDGEQRESTQILHGMNETDNEAFGEEFDMKSKHLPSRPELNRDALESPSHRLSSSSRVLGSGNRHLADLLEQLN